MIDKQDIAIVEMVLNNLNLIEQNKDLILKQRFEPFKRIEIAGLETYDDGNMFKPSAGLCHNANLYALENCYSSNDNYLLDLSILWLKQENIPETIFKLVYPVKGDNENHFLYDNENRWKYLSFLKKELYNFLQEHNHRDICHG